MSHSYNTPFEKGDQAIIKGELHNIKPFLDHTEFLVCDVDTDEARGTLKRLKQLGAIKKIGHEYVEDSGGTRAKWRWDIEYREDIKDLQERVETFDCCGHKARVHNPRWADELACPGCGKEYTKQEVLELL